LAEARKIEAEDAAFRDRIARERDPVDGPGGERVTGGNDER
jgi:hypothetical protein